MLTCIPTGKRETENAEKVCSCSVLAGDTRGPCGRAARERGTSSLEFASVLLILLSLVLGIMGLGHALYVYHAIGDAARQGTRYAMVRGSACTTWTTACPASATDVQNYVETVPSGLSAGAMTVTTTWSPNNKPGSTVNVRVQYNYKFIFPLLPSSTVSMSSDSQMVISQ
jgi:Flp pilus assembly protein TadG